MMNIYLQKGLWHELLHTFDQLAFQVTPSAIDYRQAIRAAISLQVPSSCAHVHAEISVCESSYACLPLVAVLELMPQLNV